MDVKRLVGVRGILRRRSSFVTTSAGIFILLVLMSFGIRILYVVYTTPTYYPKGDGGVYEHIAWSMVSGHGYSRDGIPSASHPPGWPLLLSAIYFIFGRNWLIARIFAALLNSLMVGVMFFTGQKLFGRKAGIIAGVVGGLYPFFIYYSGRLLDTSAHGLLLALVVLYFVKIFENPESVTNKVMGGLFLGLATITRPDILLFAAFVPMWAVLMLGRRWMALKTSALMLIPAIILVSVWTARNFFVFTRFIPGSTRGGIVLWAAHNPIAFNDIRVMGRYVPLKELPHWEELSKLSQFERNERAQELAVESIKKNLSKLPRLEVYKLYRYFFSGGALRDLLDIPILYLAAFGIVLSLCNQNMRKSCTIIYFVLSWMILVALLFFGSTLKFRGGTTTFLILMASYGFMEHIHLCRTKFSVHEVIVFPK